MYIENIKYAMHDFFGGGHMILRRSFSLASIFSLLLILVLTFNNLIVNAASPTKTYNLADLYYAKSVDPIHYYNNQLNDSDDSYPIQEGSVTVNIQCTLSTPTLGKGTVITLTGIPQDAYNFIKGEQYTVGFSEGESFTEYGNYYTTIHGKSYSNGTISYRVLTDNEPVQITFGYWNGGDEGGFDTAYTINRDGTIEGGCYDIDSDSFLKTFILNDNNFNAYIYYKCNPDLQETIGSNPQDLYNHWITVGKNEGRRAI